MAAETLLALWNDTPTRRAIVDFVQAVSTEGSPGFVVPAERVAVFDNDGTLWSEKPVPIQLDFTLFRDIPMMRFARAGGREALRLLVLHDDADREFAYTTGAEDAVDRAKTHDWTVVSMKEDWSAVFASA
jgi:3-dehydroquinate synthase class II